MGITATTYCILGEYSDKVRGERSLILVEYMQNARRQGRHRTRCYSTAAYNLRKGLQMYVAGQVRTRKYTDKDCVGKDATNNCYLAPFPSTTWTTTFRITSEMSKAPVKRREGNGAGFEVINRPVACPPHHRYYYC